MGYDESGMRDNSRENHARCGGSVGSVEETDEEGPAIDPARRCCEVTESIAGVVAAILCYGEDRNDDCEDAGECPEDGKCLG